MNDRPQFVIDAERTSWSPSSTGTTTSTISIGGSVPTAADKNTSEPTDRDTGNLAAVIVGAAIGGLLIIAVLIAVIVWLCLRSRRPKDSTARGPAGDQTDPGYNLQVLPTAASRAASHAAPAGTPHYAHPPGTAL